MKKAFGTRNILLLGLIVLMILIGGVYYFGKKPTVNWKIYINTKYGFSFEYPAGSRIVLPTLDQYKYSPDQADMVVAEKTRDITLANNSGTMFNLLVLPNETQTIADIKNQPSEEGAPKRINLTDTTIDNSPAIKYQFDCTGFTGCNAGPNVTTIHNKIRYIFTFFDEKASDQILSTFKFTN